MSSEAVGVQKQIKDQCEKAAYTYCCGHNLSLVVESVCKSSVVKAVSRLFIKIYCAHFIFYRFYNNTGAQLVVEGGGKASPAFF